MCSSDLIYGTITRDGSRYLAQGFVDVAPMIACDRCMEEVKTEVHAPLFCEFSTDEKYLGENDDVKQVTKSCIDLDDAIQEAVVMNLPMKVLCDENCKGMCRGCGTNLNARTCQCEAQDIDPRLEQLKNIFG